MWLVVVILKHQGQVELLCVLKILNMLLLEQIIPFVLIHILIEFMPSIPVHSDNLFVVLSLCTLKRMRNQKKKMKKELLSLKLEKLILKIYLWDKLVSIQSLLSVGVSHSNHLTLQTLKLNTFGLMHLSSILQMFLK